MARQIKSLAQKVAGARIQAPSAPSAPAVRNWNGSMAAGATASAYGAKNITPNSSAPASANTPTKPGGDNPVSTVPKQGKENKPKPNAPAAVADPRSDPIYRQNVAALQQQWINELGTANIEQSQANADYALEADRMLTDRNRARRDLAESMLGTGGIYSGSYGRNQREDDTDYLLNSNRLRTDKFRADQGRILDRADINARLKPLVGSEWATALREANDRQAKAADDSAANDDPVRDPGDNKGLDNEKQSGEGKPSDEGKPLGARIRTRNRQIRVLRRKIDNTSNPHREKVLRDRLQKARKQRNKLVRKAKNGKA